MFTEDELMLIVQRSQEAHTSIRSTMRAVRELPAECRGPIPAGEKEVLAVIKSWLTEHGGTIDNRYRVILQPMLLGNGVTSNAFGEANPSANSDCEVHGLPPNVEVFFDEELAKGRICLMDNLEEESDEEDHGISVQKLLDAAEDAPDPEDEVTSIFQQIFQEHNCQEEDLWSDAAWELEALLPEKTELNFNAAAGDPLFVGDTEADCLTVGEDPSSWDKNQTCDTVLEKDSEGVALRTCKEKRFEVIRTVHGEEIRPRDWYYYFAPERTIRRWMRDPEFCKLRARRDARTGRDFWTAALAKHIDHVTGGALLSPSSFTAEDPPPQGGDPGVEYAEHRSMVISPGADDAQLWVSDIGSYSMGVGVLKCDDLHITARQRDKWHRNLWITRGPRQKEKNPLVIWGQFERDMQRLATGFDVYDSFLKRTYTLKVFLGMVHADSVMRITMGQFMGVGSYRADAYSLFEGTSGPGGKGMYFKGYAKPVKLQMTTVQGKPEVYADEQLLMLSKEGHAALVSRTIHGGESPQSTGRHGRGALERIPYFDPMHGYAVPFGHCVLYGVVKRFWKLLMGKVTGVPDSTLTLPKTIQDEMQARAKLVKPPHDVIRKYNDIVQYFGECTK
ncbi:hypothetical protein CYMTET_29403 [Cymbomonas tetramitiformis]|uniref:Uncharacterized protein n=1 Tax=Cymbomonas tetramitiformis TaxID=36881 RepID=A0AAE0KUZ1_9CHLO|nr:hypothetical protein CYMTET_29403 [Cymbomonas tetramitiformis]